MCSGGATQGPRMTPFSCLLLCWLALPLPGLEILDPEEVEYVRFNVTAAVGGSATLDCGPAAPDIFIWGFTEAGGDSNVALAHNYGQGPKLQPRSGSLGRVRLHAASSALVIDELEAAAAGTYTCQALYDTAQGARVTFYFTRLHLEDK